MLSDKVLFVSIAYTPTIAANVYASLPPKGNLFFSLILDIYLPRK